MNGAFTNPGFSGKGKGLISKIFTNKKFSITLLIYINIVV